MLSRNGAIQLLLICYLVNINENDCVWKLLIIMFHYHAWKAIVDDF